MPQGGTPEGAARRADSPQIVRLLFAFAKDTGPGNRIDR
jgi:hypothetical protein